MMLISDNDLMMIRIQMMMMIIRWWRWWWWWWWWCDDEDDSIRNQLDLVVWHHMKVDGHWISFRLVTVNNRYTAINIYDFNQLISNLCYWFRNKPFSRYAVAILESRIRWIAQSAAMDCSPIGHKVETENEMTKTPIKSGQVERGVTVMLESSSTKSCDNRMSSSSSKQSSKYKSKKSLMYMASTPIKTVQPKISSKQSPFKRVLSQRELVHGWW